jgi:hypothetical protein
MLYDNAQLARVYLHAWQVTGDEFYRTIVKETLDYVAREMRGPQGEFYSTQDTDSEGEEGKFFAWTGGKIRRCWVRRPRPSWWPVASSPAAIGGQEHVHRSDTAYPYPSSRKSSAMRTAPSEVVCIPSYSKPLACGSSTPSSPMNAS